MAYSNKTYICFDADTDMTYYNLMKAWKEHDHLAFNFHNAHDLNNLRGTSTEETIKAKLRERLSNTKVMIVLIGEKTRFLYKFVRWEIQYAIDNNIPIIAVNLNKSKFLDKERCPAILQSALAIHVPFGMKIVDYALNHWPAEHATRKSNGDTGAYWYSESVYTRLGL